MICLYHLYLSRWRWISRGASGSDSRVGATTSKHLVDRFASVLNAKVFQCLVPQVISSFWIFRRQSQLSQEQPTNSKTYLVGARADNCNITCSTKLQQDRLATKGYLFKHYMSKFSGKKPNAPQNVLCNAGEFVFQIHLKIILMYLYFLILFPPPCHHTCFVCLFMSTETRSFSANVCKHLVIQPFRNILGRMTVRSPPALHHSILGHNIHDILMNFDDDYKHLLFIEI